MFSKVQLFVVTWIFLCLITFFTLRERSYCLISNAPSKVVNGYYSEYRGDYYILPDTYKSFLDVFGLIETVKPSGFRAFISNENGKEWHIYETDSVYSYLILSSTDIDSHHPPSTHWIDSKTKELSNVQVQCFGSLTPFKPHEASNIELIFQRPMTHIIIAILCYIAYYIWANHIDPSSVTYSYTAFIDAKEYWRIFTASVTHFDLIHLGFNTMAVYQLDLESIYGSVAYTYLSINLIVITLLIETALYAIFIHIFHIHHFSSDQSIGYSCVVFAWLVAATVRMDTYCPLDPFLPKFCFQTYHIPLGIFDFPINIGPIILLIITKFIIPRSSFTGHLSGVLIGFPLAWNALNWCTPPIFLAMIIPAIIVFRGLFIHKFPGFYDYTTAISDIVSERTVYTVISHMITIGILICTCIGMIWLNIWNQFYVRIIMILLVILSYKCYRCMCLTDSRITHEQGVEYLLTTLVMISGMIIIDSCTLIGTLSKDVYIQSIILTSIPLYYFAISIYTIAIISELLFVIITIMLLQSHARESRYTASLLTWCNLDTTSIQHDIRQLCCCFYKCISMYTNRPFSGTGRRLELHNNNTTTTSTTNSSHISLNSLNKKIPISSHGTDDNSPNVNSIPISPMNGNNFSSSGSSQHRNLLNIYENNSLQAIPIVTTIPTQDHNISITTTILPFTTTTSTSTSTTNNQQYSRLSTQDENENFLEDKIENGFKQQNIQRAQSSQQNNNNNNNNRNDFVNV